jgi:hypothetical protein
MRWRRVLLLGWAGLWLLIVATPAWPILIETGPNKRRVGGYVEREDANKIVLRIPTDSGKPKIETFERSKIKILHRVDRDLLEKLTRDQPNAYLDYAEELAERKDDPEAFDTAMRLYLIAAYLDPAKNGPRCLLGMSTLTTNSADARKYRAMAFLLDAKRDPALLKKDQSPAVIPVAALQSFQQALRKYRTGDVMNARELATAKGVGDCFRAAPGMMDPDAFAQACTDAVCPRCRYTNRNNVKCSNCNGRKRLPSTNQICPTCNGKGVVKCSTCNGTGVNTSRLDQHVDTIVRGELWALDRLAPDAASATKPAAARSWASALSNPQLTPIPVLTLETIADYDPRKCVFRNGNWVAP